VPSPVQPIV